MMPQILDKRDEAIVAWVAKNRGESDFTLAVRRLLWAENPRHSIFRSLLYAGFEAGRQLQAEHPELKLNDPQLYL